jgi:hypothetical protein
MILSERVNGDDAKTAAMKGDDAYIHKRSCICGKKYILYQIYGLGNEEAR